MKAVNFLLYVSVFKKLRPAQEKIIYKFSDFSPLKSEPTGSLYLLF